MHAMIIEDEFLIALSLETMLRDLGFTSFACVATEEQAIAAAARRCPDLITADVRLRDGDGLAAVRSICRQRRIPVIFVTATPERLGEVPLEIVVRKPFEAATLARAIRAARRLVAAPAEAARRAVPDSRAAVAVRETEHLNAPRRAPAMAALTPAR